MPQILNDDDDLDLASRLSLSLSLMIDSTTSAAAAGKHDDCTMNLFVALEGKVFGL